MCKQFWHSNRKTSQRGVSMVEVLVVVAISFVVIGMAAKAMFSAVNTYRVDTASNQVASLVHLAKVKAASQNTRYRVAVSGSAYVLERYNRASSAWETDLGSVAVTLPPGVAFSATSPTTLTTPPTEGGATVTEAANLTFNSRALLVDDSGVLLDGGCFYLQGSTLQPLAVCSNLPGRVRQYKWNGSAWQAK